MHVNWRRLFFLSMLNALIFGLLALPWLNPFAPGPSPAAMPLLFSWGCAAGLWGTGFWRSNGLVRARLVAIVFAAWLAVGLVSSAIGLLQYFGAVSGLDPWVNQTAVGEAFANLRQRNQFATLTNIALVALLWWVHLLAPVAVQVVPAGRAVPPNVGDGLLNGQSAAALGAAAAPLSWLAAALLAAGNAASSSRTGLLQLVLLVAMVLWWGGWRAGAVRRVLVVAALGYAAAVVALPWLAGFDLGSQSMFARLRDGAPACSSRWLLWSNVLDLVAQKPLLGWGWGELDYAHYINPYPGARFCEILDNAHNLPLHLAVELGLPVAALVCGALVWWVVRQRPWREADPTRQLAWAVLALVGLHSLLEYPLWYGPFQMAVAMCLVMLWRPQPASGVPSNVKNQSNSGLVQVFVACAAISLIAFISYAAWDYRRVSQIYMAAPERDAALREDTLAKISSTWLFRNQFLFAQLGVTPLTFNNARWTYATATALLHYSPEPRVIEKVIESATLLGLDTQAMAHLARYQAAFPKESAKWSGARGNAAD